MTQSIFAVVSASTADPAHLTGQQDSLVPATGLHVTDDLGGILVFRNENQDCAFWAIPLAGIEQDDPTVGESRDGWTPFLDRMSLAWVELVLRESLFGADDLRLHDPCELPDALLPSLHGRCARVDLPDHPLWAGKDDSPVRWYSAPGRPHSPPRGSVSESISYARSLVVGLEGNSP